MRKNDYRLIRIEELQVFANHGVFEEETKNGQNFYINAELGLAQKAADCLKDELQLSVNYAEVCEEITSFMKENTCKLLERIAELLCVHLLNKYQLITYVVIEIRKPEAPINLPFRSVSVERQLSRHKAFLSLGSNIGEKRTYLENAVCMLSASDHTKVIRESDIITTKAYGYTQQDDFLNMAVEVETYLSPAELLDFIHEIEQAADRKREIHWGPRTLDIDIVFYDRLCVSEDNLLIPHIDMHNRYFVLKPLSQICPNYRHPLLQKTVIQMLEELPKDEYER